MPVVRHGVERNTEFGRGESEWAQWTGNRNENRREAIWICVRSLLGGDVNEHRIVDSSRIFHCKSRSDARPEMSVGMSEFESDGTQEKSMSGGLERTLYIRSQLNVSSMGLLSWKTLSAPPESKCSRFDEGEWGWVVGRFINNSGRIPLIAKSIELPFQIQCLAPFPSPFAPISRSYHHHNHQSVRLSFRFSACLARLPIFDLCIFQLIYFVFLKLLFENIIQFSWLWFLLLMLLNGVEIIGFLFENSLLYFSIGILLLLLLNRIISKKT